MPSPGWGTAAAFLGGAAAIGGLTLGVDLSGIDLSSALGSVDTSNLPDPSSFLNNQQNQGSGSPISADQAQHYAGQAAHYLSQHHGGGGQAAGGQQFSSGSSAALTKRTGMPILKNVSARSIGMVTTCDLCKGTIIGDKYKCLQCHDWDCCPGCAARCTSLTHDGSHRFLFIPANGKYIHCTRDVLSRVCFFCRKTVKTQESFACLECDPLIQTCIDCEASRDQHLRSTGHLFLIERQSDLACDGCHSNISSTDWWKCLSCPDVGFCSVCVVPFHSQHPQNHHFLRTTGYESYNYAPWGGPDHRFPHHGDERFWGRLLLDDGRPSPQYERLGKAIFEYLDNHGPPGRTDWFEPEKNRWWNKLIEPALTDQMKDEAFKLFHETFGTNYHMIWSNGKQIPALNRWGFMEDLTLSIRLDPDEAFKSLSYSIRNFGLIDSATGIPFPPIPRSSIPSFPNSELARKMRDVFYPAYARLA